MTAGIYSEMEFIDSCWAQSGRLDLRLSQGLLIVTWLIMMTWQ